MGVTFVIDQVNRQAVTTHSMTQVANSDFSIIEIKDRYLWSIQANREHSLSVITQTLFHETAQFGSMLTTDSLRLIQLWPHKAYLLAAQPSLPGGLQEFTSMVTDISHGFCELSFVGDQAFELLNSHTSADLKHAQVARTCNLRCLLGQYQIILWWDLVSDIHILIDRSYAQSFCDYLEQLRRRWSQAAI